MKVVLRLSDSLYELIGYAIKENHHQGKVKIFGDLVQLDIVDGKKAIIYEGPKEKLHLLQDLFSRREIRYVNFEVLDYVTDTPEWLWWETETQYLVRMGKEHILELICTPYEGWGPREFMDQFNLYSYSLQLAILQLWKGNWSYAIRNGRKARVY